MATNNKYPSVAWQDPDDVPDLSTPEWQAIFDKVPVRRGRPPVLSPKVSTNIRLDADILEAYRAQGPGGRRGSMRCCGSIWSARGGAARRRFPFNGNIPLTSWRFRTSVCPEIQAQGAQDAR